MKQIGIIFIILAALRGMPGSAQGIAPLYFLPYGRADQDRWETE